MTWVSFSCNGEHHSEQDISIANNNITKNKNSYDSRAQAYIRGCSETRQNLFLKRKKNDFITDK